MQICRQHEGNYLQLFTYNNTMHTKVLLSIHSLGKFQVIFTPFMSNMDLYENTIS